MVDHGIRKRNVTTRDRTGCVTCRTRRSKCDERKPHCNNCTRLNLECGGYATPIKFKDQTDLLKQKHGRKRKEKAQTPASSEPSSSSHAPETVEPAAQSHQVGGLITTPGDETFHSANESHEIFDDSQELSRYEAATSLALISGGVLQDSPLPSNPSCVDAPSFYASFGDTTVQTDEALGGEDNDNTNDGTNTPYGDVATLSSTPAYPRMDSPLLRQRQSEQANRQLTSVPTIPVGLLESAKFAEDMADHLDKAFFHAALALAALDISQARPNEALGSKAALQALDHFVTALGTVRMAQLDDEGVATGCPPNQDNAISWLATLLLLANFELQRGQMKLWYIHSRAAVTFLSQHLNRVQDSPVGESLIRSFSRIAALLDIFDRAYSVRYSIASPDVSDSLSRSLVNSPHSADRLLYILPRVIKLEEEWRSNPQHDLHWREQAEGLIQELKAWRRTLPDCDVPPLHEHTASPYNEDAEGPGISIRPLSIPYAPEPVKAATTFMHYLVSLLRLETRYLPGAVRQLPPNAKKIVLLVLRLAAGVPYASCAAVNTYSHGMVAAMMNCYYMSEEQEVKDWVKNWIAGFPRDREGIWNVRHAHRVLSYVDQEYTRRGSRYNWEIIKVRLIDLETDATPSEDEEMDPDKFSVEIYSRCKRGWSIDFVEIP
ncbi:fungal-specific transcription factor domain-containing protein [Colletotrichum godetiae]|uniref:Fungal-specific transcription factor domain-containing protein n=1 Tax=Colletotrichum godetiae TaxID=1209918 RepID=A0AAJ0AL33_9PEZI|nr:fungal-specific transcription factor domain-containing protein [Colletotrichum godetiae]KAK1675215.1 fungal-specific transcription factor domain-containing protein [Colletotrichum godetiae]